MLRWRTWVNARVLRLSLVVLPMSVAVAWAASAEDKATKKTIPPTTSNYVRMRDGVEIAVTVHLPAALKAGERVPVLMRTTRYWREFRMGWGLRGLAALHLVRRDILVDRQVAYFNKRHFAVVLADARGSGASGGNRVMEYSAAEVADMGEVAAWAAEQPWSNGRVGTFGISYEGNTAELAAVPNQPAIDALMPLYDEFDNWENLAEGGVLARSFLKEWSDVVAALDRDDVCGALEAKRLRCLEFRFAISGVQRVDADPHGKHLAELLQQRHNVNVAKAINNLEFRDDLIDTAEGKLRWQDISPYGFRPQIERSKAPMMVWAGWLDGDPEGTLVRYRTFSNPQVVIIGPLSHGGDFNVDPFASKHKPAEPITEEQFKMEADFFERVLRNDASDPVESSIQYYTMGERKWHTTKVWPPTGLSAERLYFGEHNTLSTLEPSAATASDAYTVDFTASTGTQTRWDTGLGGGDVVYPDRAQEDRKILVYDSAPLETDLEITGSPVLTVEISSTTSDGALHAYLEDVAPGGRVTYVDEGVFRMIDRKEVDAKNLPYEPIGPAHSFMREDAEPLVPREPARIRFSLCATSVLLRRGHRIRLALAGADAHFFQRYPKVATPTWTVYRDAVRASFIELPVRHVADAAQ